MAVQIGMELARMTKVFRMLAGSGLAAGLGVILLGFSGAFGAQVVEAQSPPSPPARFAGSVTVDGAPVPAGTVIEARVGGVVCDVKQTFNQGAEARYVVDVVAKAPGAPNCGTDDADVAFYIGGKQAKETGKWVNSQLNILNLTYVTPTPTPAGGASVPKPPTTGNLGPSESGSNSGLWLLFALGAGALAFAAGGTVVARRGR